MSSPLSKTSSRCSSHVPRKSYGRFDFLVCDWSLQKKSYGAGEKIESDEFIMSDSSKWVIRIFPGGRNSRQSGYVSAQVVLLDLGNNQDSATATFNISVLHSDGKTFSMKSPCALHFQLGDEAENSWSVDNFICASDLEISYLENDAVLFTLDIEVLGKREWIKSTMPAYTEHCKSLGDDLEELLNGKHSGFESDITLVADKKKLRCHRVILAARSEVFKQKFQSVNFNTKLLFGGQYHLTDISAVVFEEMIRFVYTDTCSDAVLSIHSKSLLSAAHRFKLPRLIQICEDYVGETLTAETVVDTLNMATELKLSRLHKCCSEFISTHETDIVATGTLKNLQTNALKDLVVSGILPKSTMIHKTEEEDMGEEKGIQPAPSKNSVPSIQNLEEDEDEEIKDAMADLKDTDMRGEKLKSEGDFIPDSGGNRQEQVV